MTPIVYDLDLLDRIVKVNKQFDLFADANGADHLIENQVLGKSLWDFVTGDDTTRIWRLVFSRVRAEGKAISVNFRCDAPDARRYMILQVEPLPDQGLRCTSSLLLEEPRKPIARPIYAALTSKPMHQMCSQCCQINFRGQWREFEDALASGLSADSGLDYRVCYTVCPTCQQTINQALPPNDGACKPVS